MVQTTKPLFLDCHCEYGDSPVAPLSVHPGECRNEWECCVKPFVISFYTHNPLHYFPTLLNIPNPRARNVLFPHTLANPTPVSILGFGILTGKGRPTPGFFLLLL